MIFVIIYEKIAIVESLHTTMPRLRSEYKSYIQVIKKNYETSR